MQNPILNRMNNNALNNLSNSKFASMIQMLKGANNPMGMMNNLLTQNPKMKQVLEQAQQYGNSPKEAFYKLAQEKGVNPEEFLKHLGV